MQPLYLRHLDAGSLGGEGGDWGGGGGCPNSIRSVVWLDQGTWGATPVSLAPEVDTLLLGPQGGAG